MYYDIIFQSLGGKLRVENGGAGKGTRSGAMVHAVGQWYTQWGNGTRSGAMVHAVGQWYTQWGNGTRSGAMVHAVGRRYVNTMYVLTYQMFRGRNLTYGGKKFTYGGPKNPF